VKGRFCCWLVAACLAGPPVLSAEDGWWRRYDDVEFDDEQSFDGDSFHLRVKSGQRRFDWVIRLYGVDCPETDDRFADRNAEQARHFGVAEKAVERWGKKAARWTRDALRKAREIRLHVGQPKEKTRQTGRQEQRYYGVVELIDGDGKSSFLHEELLSEGLARAFGMPAPWPPRDAERDRKKAREGFRRDLDRLERAAKREGKGIWGD
jgi:endonuclease YncB( thermonuclease family)